MVLERKEVVGEEMNCEVQGARVLVLRNVVLYVR
jgi:hypothetical protein